jgi:uncharacterized protein (TIGR03437 family)
MVLDHVAVMIKPSAAQQSDLEQLLGDQQNPSSPRFHRWLTPGEYGDRFGLSASDHSKVVAWLAGEGFQVKDAARSRNFVVFRATVGQVERSLRTSIHRYRIDGDIRFANASAPSVPEALADVVEGFLGLDDFPLEPQSRPIEPNYTLGGAHYLSPEDFSTIYNLGPLYKQGLDGTGQSIAVVGQSALLVTDIRSFRSRFNLPANDPRMVLYSGTDPGFTGSQVEGNLDVQWVGAIAPKATIYYVYGTSAFSAFLYSVSQNIAPIISISYGGCEPDYRATYYRSIAQQANAQGITVLAASGDSGATCNTQGSAISARGRTALFPTVLPEITSVGGTILVEGRGNYWASSNSASGGSALSYIPEAAMNETSQIMGIFSGGGGSSQFHSRPVWQRGAGIADGGMRQYPDVSFTAATHDGYLVLNNGALVAVGGTSASTPAMAGIVALLNQQQVSKGLQPQPGLGNINPQLYRLAQAAPQAFHDITDGDNIVPCAQGTPDCLTGTIGDRAAAGFDMTTGLGSIDAEQFFQNWNLATRPATVSLVLSTTRPSINGTMDATALVNGAGGTPTGSVQFSLGGVPLGTVALESRGIQGQAADITFPVYMLGSTGTVALTAHYSGDAAFNGGGAARNLTLIAPTGSAAIAVSAPNTVWPSFPDAEGLGWQTTITLRDFAGVASMVTGMKIDGEAVSPSKYLSSTSIPAGGVVTMTAMFRKLATPLVRRFQFSGVDSGGQTWSRDIEVNFSGSTSSMGFLLTATPLVVARTSDPACEWPVQVNVESLDGNANTLTALFVGGLLRSDLSAVFGTDRLAPWGSLQGMVCFNGIVPPASGYIQVNGADGFVQEVLVSFGGPTPSPAKLTTVPASVTLAAPGTAQATVAVNTADKTQAWTVSVYPASRMGAWLTVTPTSGVGPGQITLSAKGAGYGPGAYKATVVIQSPTGAPQSMVLPVMFVNGAAGSGMSISGVVEPPSGRPVGAPGGLLTIYGKGLAQTTATPTVISPVPLSLGGVSVAVNGVAAPVLYASPDQVNIQIPFEVGAGPAVVGVTNESGVAGAHFTIAPSAPAIFAASSDQQIQTGAISTLYLTGAGEIGSSFRTGFTTSPAAFLATSAKPLLPISVTVGGVPAFVHTVGAAPGLLGMVQVNYIPAAGTPEGAQTVVVTVGDGSSAPAPVTVKH